MPELSPLCEQKRTSLIAPSSIPRQLATAPVRVFPVGVEHALGVAVQGSHDADAREHRRAAARRNEDQRRHCRLPLWSHVLCLRKLRDVGPGVFERDKLSVSGKEIGSPRGPVSGYQQASQAPLNFFSAKVLGSR
jgi:hypothetical protein